MSELTPKGCRLCHGTGERGPFGYRTTDPKPCQNCGGEIVPYHPCPSCTRKDALLLEARRLLGEVEHAYGCDWCESSAECDDKGTPIPNFPHREGCLLPRIDKELGREAP